MREPNGSWVDGVARSQPPWKASVDLSHPVRHGSLSSSSGFSQACSCVVCASGWVMFYGGRCLFLTEASHLVQTHLEPVILLPQPPELWALQVCVIRPGFREVVFKIVCISCFSNVHMAVYSTNLGVAARLLMEAGNLEKNMKSH